MNIKKKYVKYITFETIIFLIIVSISLYFIFTTSKSWFPYQGFTNSNFDLSSSFKIYPKKSGRSTSAREEQTRYILEKIYNKKFPPARPNFLKNPSTGHNLEIDCFNEELKLGVEVDGKQHAEYVPYFHESVGAFRYQVAKDDYKKKKCEVEGITLINIPHFVHTNDLERYLRLKLIKYNMLS